MNSSVTRALAATAMVFVVTLAVSAQAPVAPPVNGPERERIETINERFGINPTPRDVLKKTFYPDRLNLPTHLARAGEYWFITDSYNNRVIYSDRLDLPIRDWLVLDEQLSRPHSLASDGRYYVVDDTDAHALRVYIREGETFKLKQMITDVGARPHRVLFDPDTEAFYALASRSQEMVKLVITVDSVSVKFRRHLPDLNAAYTRSFQLIDGKMYIASGPGYITVLEYRDDSYRLLGKYNLPQRLQGMNDLFRVGDKWYINATLNIALECDSLAQLEQDECRSVYDDWQLTGNPYYFSFIDDRYFVTQVAGGDNIVELELRNGQLQYKREPNYHYG